MKLASILQGRVWPIYLLAISLSVILSTWISGRELVINPDGICYLMSAEAWSTFSLSGVMHLCAQAGWPFYPWLIHVVMTITGVSALVAANVLDGLFSAITVAMFIALVQILGGSRRVLALAAFVILLSHEFNSARQYIVRDHGYWAFYLISLFFFVRYFQEGKLSQALAWAVSLTLATLFRIEGAIFFLLLPLAAWCLPRGEHKAKRFLILLTPCLIGMMAVLVFAVTSPSSWVDSGRVHELFLYLTQSGTSIVTRFNDAKAALIANVLPLEAAREAGWVWFLTLIIWYATNILQNISLIMAALLIYAWVSACAAFQPKHRLAVVAYLVVNAVITAVFFAQHLFLSKRYLIAFTLTLTLWVPFALARLLSLRVGRVHRLAYVMALVLILASSLGVILDRGPSKAYVREAGDWLALNVPADAALYTNDVQLMYYAKHDGYDIFKNIIAMREPLALSDGGWRHYQYIALRVRANDTKWANAALAMNLQPMRTYSGPNGDAILIYKIGM